MKINTPSEKYIFIELSRSDMEKLNLSYEDMDYSDEETRKAIYSVLDRARISLGQNFRLSDTLKVEALPRDDGGCFLFFTIAVRNICFRVVKSHAEIYFRADNIDSFFDFCASLDEKERESISASLYSSGDKYYLHLKGRIHRLLILKACEYAYPLKKDEFDSLNAGCLIENSALEILGGSVSES